MNEAKRKYNGCFKSGVTTPPQQYQTKGEAIGIAGEVAEIARLRDINKDLLEACEGMLRWAQRVKELNPGMEVA